MRRRHLVGLAMAAGSGVLYGSINVLAKPVDLHPAWLATILYLTASAVLLPYALRLRLTRHDLPKVLAMGILGGAVAPMLLLYGLRSTAATDAGLVLTLEMVATAVFAIAFLGERYRGREWLGLLCLLAAAGLVALASGDSGASTTAGMLLVLGAAIAWGVDNTVSARLVGDHQPQGLIAVKGLIGGALNAVWLAVLRPDLPSGGQVAAGAALGLASIAVSSVLFYHALQRVGAGRTSAMNIATTAAIGALGGVLLLGERLVPLHAAALAAAGLGALLLSTHRESEAAALAAPLGPG